jgi:Big-like domain-containing protein
MDTARRVRPRKRPSIVGQRLLLAVAAAALALAPTAWSPTVRGLSLLPIAVADNYSALHDRVLAVTAANGVLKNDVNLLGSTTAVLNSTTTHGSLSLKSDGSFTYTPAAGFVGTDQFRYHDSGLIPSGTVTATITVTNAAPVAAADSYTATTGVTRSVAAPGVLGNDTDADGDGLTAELVAGGGNGSLSFNANGSFTFTSGGSFTGPRTFTYRVTDGVTWSGTATVTINVSAPAPTPTPTPAPTPTPTPTPAPTPTPTPTPAPTPTPTPAPTPTPTPAPTPTPTPRPTPTPTLPLPTLPLPTLPLPTALPTIPVPIPTPTIGPGSIPTPTPAASATASAAAPAASGNPSSGSGGPAATPSPGSGSGPGAIGPGGTGGGPADPGSGGSGLTVGGDKVAPFGLATVSLGSFDNIDWAVPALALTVPGLLLMLAVLAQLSAGILWLPIVRRGLGGFGLGRRRRRREDAPADGRIAP